MALFDNEWSLRTAQDTAPNVELLEVEP
jgi:hypothetical protein